MNPYRIGQARVLLVVISALLVAPTLRAQSPDDVPALRERLRARYDILALQDGVGLVPRDRGEIRVVEIRKGVVSVDGREVTGRELRERLGADAETILRVTYLDTAGQRALAEAAGGPAPPPAPEATPPPPAEPAAGAPPAPNEDAEKNRTRTRRQDVSRVGGNVQVGAGEVVDGDVNAVMGSATVDGEVTGDVNVVMGRLTLGPTAHVHGDANVIGGAVDKAQGARVDGETNNVGFGGRFNPRWGGPATFMGPFMWRVGSLVGTLLQIGLIGLLALIAIAIARTWVEPIADHTAADPVRAGLVGFFAELLFVPAFVIACIVLAISIIGIPLLILFIPLAIVGLLVVLLVGFTGVAYQVGRLLNARFGWADRSIYATVIAGVVAIGAMRMIAGSVGLAGGSFFAWPLAMLGSIVEYAAWTVGFGSAIQVWLRRRRGTPPPLPV